MVRALSTLLVIALIAACGGTRVSGPAWPKQTDPDEDGGHSLAPLAPAAATVEASDDEEPEKPDAEPVEAEAKPEAEPETTEDATAATETPESTADEIIITTEEIVIEVEDE